MSPDEIEQIASAEVQLYISDHEDSDEKKLLLQQKEILGLPFALIAQQIAIRRKAKAKLPLFFNTPGIVYPPSLNWEQCSSEATGRFKAAIIQGEVTNEQRKVADLTGGFGIDCFFLSRKAASACYVDPNLHLLRVSRHNHLLLGGDNIIYHHTTAEDFLNQSHDRFDLIYLDPSRRDSNFKKVFRLIDCEPNASKLLPKIFKAAERVLIKTSPLLDIHLGLKELAHVKKVFVISVDNECRELLFLLQANFFGSPVIETYNLDKTGNPKQDFSFTYDEEKNTVSDFSEPLTFLYEPNASILKAGAYKLIGKKFGLQKISTNTHFYTSANLKEKFPGRIFKINQLEFDTKSLTDKKANVITRNYPLPAEGLKRKLKISDGGENYVIGFSSLKKKYVVHATRLV